MPAGSELTGAAGRYAAEKLKLKAQQALRIKMAMAKLVGNFDHSDLILECSDGRQLPAHLCILKNRAPGFYSGYIEPHDASVLAEDGTGANRPPPVVKIQDIDYNSLKFFLRCIYTAEEVPSNPSVCAMDNSTLTTSSMSSSEYDEEGKLTHRVLTSSTLPSSSRCQDEQQSPTKLTTSGDSHSSARTFIMDESDTAEQTNSHQSTPARMPNIYSSPDRGTRALTVSAYSSVSDSVVESAIDQGNAAMVTSFAELATATSSGASGRVHSGFQSTTSVDSANSKEQNQRISEKADTLPRQHRADVMIGKFIRVDSAGSSSEQSPQQQQQLPPADKKIFPMFIEMDSCRPSRLSLCEPDSVPLAVAAVAVRRSGSGCTIDSPGRSQMGRKRWSVTSLRSIDSADLASPLSSHGSVITGLDEEQTDAGDASAVVHEACSRLGKDLLDMLMQRKDPDLTILTSGAELKAHRCVLATACPYFKAMLNGDWLESRNGVIELKDYSESVVMCALRLIYGGVVDVPENVSVWDLISFADMVQLDDLKHVAYLHIRGKYCHFFHKPCSGCVNGVLECLPSLRSLAISELLDECCRWQAKYFGRIWRTKLFNSLPEDALDLCYRSVLQSMTPNNILDTILGCEKLQLTLPKSKSAEAAGALVSCLIDASFEYLSAHLDQVVESTSFTSLGKGYALNLGLFEDLLPGVIHSLSPDTGCKSLVKLYELMALIASQQQTGEEDWNDRFVNLLRRLYELCDTHLIHYASAVTRCDNWKLLTADMQRRIQETGIFVDLRAPTAPPPRFSSFNRSYKRSSSSADRVRDRSVSVQRFRPPPPLTEYPSKTNVMESTTVKVVRPPGRVKSSTSERRKVHRQPGPHPAPKLDTKSPAPSTSVDVGEGSNLKRSSTTELHPGTPATVVSDVDMRSTDGTGGGDNERMDGKIADGTEAEPSSRREEPAQASPRREPSPPHLEPASTQPSSLKQPSATKKRQRSEENPKVVLAEDASGSQAPVEAGTELNGSSAEKTVVDVGELASGPDQTGQVADDGEIKPANVKPSEHPPAETVERVAGSDSGGVENDENAPSEQGTGKVVRDRTASTAADRGRSGVKLTQPVTPSTKKATPISVAKPTAKVAGIPKTVASSSSPAPSSSSSQHRRAPPSSGCAGPSADATRATRVQSSAASRARPAGSTQSPGRKTRNANRVGTKK